MWLCTQSTKRHAIAKQLHRTSPEVEGEWERPAAHYIKTQPVPLRRLVQQWEQLVVNNGILYRYYAQPREDQGYLQLVVPTAIREQILRELHEGVASGHLGQDKTLHQLKERFYWLGHFNDVRDWYQTCATCATRK